MGTEGRGEGIVWKASVNCEDPAFWFKSKGDDMAVSHSNKLPAIAVSRENRERVENFAKAIVTEARLEQGWELSQKDQKSVGLFLKWITTDCCDEERREMEKLEISKGKLNPVITSIAKPWYFERLGKARSEMPTPQENDAVRLS